MKGRPISVAIISWLFIAYGILGMVVMLIWSINNPLLSDSFDGVPMKAKLQLILDYAKQVVLLTSGIAMLNGRNWGRWLFLGWAIVTIMVYLVKFSVVLDMLQLFAFYAVVFYFLFSPNANAFFSDKKRVLDDGV